MKLSNIEVLHMVMQSFSAMSETFAAKQREHAAMCNKHGVDPQEILRLASFRLSLNNEQDNTVAASWDILKPTHDVLKETNND